MNKLKVGDTFTLYSGESLTVIKRCEKMVILDYSSHSIVLKQFRRKIHTRKNHEYIKFLDYLLIAE